MNSRTSQDIVQELKKKQLKSPPEGKLSHKELRKLIKKEKRKDKRSVIAHSRKDKRLNQESKSVQKASPEATDPETSEKSVEEKKRLASRRAAEVLRKRLLY